MIETLKLYDQIAVNKTVKKDRYGSYFHYGHNPEGSYNKNVLNTFAKVSGKYLQWSLLLVKLLAYGAFCENS